MEQEKTQTRREEIHSKGFDISFWYIGITHNNRSFSGYLQNVCFFVGRNVHCTYAVVNDLIANKTLVCHSERRKTLAFCVVEVFVRE